MINEWKRWDLHPHGQHEAKQMEAAATVEAQHLGLTTTDLRILLSELRRDGMSCEEALEYMKKVVALDVCSDVE